MKIKKLEWISVLILLTGCTGLAGVNPDGLTDLLSEAFSHQITQFSIAFSIAAWIHSGRVKKEIRNQFENIVGSIDNVASALKQDLAAQGARIISVENGLNQISMRVDAIEKQTKGEV